jgi:hypothetical protein
MANQNNSIIVPPDDPGKLLLAAQCGLPMLPLAIRKQLAPLLTYESMAIIAGTAIAVAGAHAIGVGFVFDIILGGVTFAIIGSDLIQAGKHASNFYQLAIAAKNTSDFDIAGKEFASFVTLAGINVILALFAKSTVSRITRPVVNQEAKLAAWYSFISRIKFIVPRDKGILWTKIEAIEAERLARANGLVSLEMLLKEEGFLDLYSQQFGTLKNVKSMKLEKVTESIWKMTSKRYVESLEGKVTAFINRKSLHAKIAEREPIFIEEMWDISEAMEINNRIHSVEIIDISTGRKWFMLRSEVLKAVKSGKLEPRKHL